MNKLTTVIINNKGFIVSFSSHDETFLAAFPPKLGDPLFENIANKQTKDIFENNIKPLFSSVGSIDFTLSLENTPYQITAFANNKEEVVTCWKQLKTEQEQQNHSLDGSHKWFTSLSDLAFRNSINPKTVFRRDGSIIDFNKAASDLLGYTEAAYSQLTVFELSIRHTPQTWEVRWQMLKDNIQQKLQSKLRRKDGSIVDVEIHTEIVSYEDSEVGFCTYTDISEKLQLEKELNTADFAFRHSAIPQHFLNNDGSVYDFNEAACQLFGYTMEEYRKLSIFDFTIRHNPERWKIRWEEIKIEGSFPYTVKLRKKDHSVIDVEIRSEILSYGDKELLYSTMTDVTESIKADEQLKLIDFSLKRVGTAIVYFNADGSIYNFNSAFADLYGFNESELRAKTIFDFGTGFTPSYWEQYWNTLKANGETYLNSKRQKKDGSWFDVEIRANYIKYGNLELNCAIVTDITEKKRINDRLRLVDFGFRNASTAILLVDDAGNIYDFNEASSKMLGYTNQELNEIKIGQIDVLQSSKERTEFRNELRETKRLTQIKKLRKKDGSYIVVELKSNYLLFDGMEMNYAFMTDITEKLRLDEQLQLIDFSFKNVATSIVYYREDGSFYSYNDAFPQLFGYTVEEFTSFNLFDFNSSFTKDTFKEYWNEVKEKRSFTFTGERKRRDGTRMILEITPNFITFNDTELICSFLQDITDKVTLEHKLEVQRSFYEDILNNIPTNIAVIDKDCRYIFINPNAIKDEETRKWMIGKTDEDYAIYKNRNLTVANNRMKLLQEVATSKEVNGFYENITNTNNEIEYHYRSIYPVLDEQKELRFLIGHGVNITELKRKDQRLQLVDFSFRYAGLAMSFIKMNGELLDFNDATCKLLGYTRSEYKKLIVHRDINISFDEQQWKQRIADIKAGKVLLITTLKRKDGVLLDIEVNSSIIDYEGEEIIFAFYNDITERLKTEELLRKSIERYQYATLATSDVVWESDLIKKENFISQNFTTFFGHPVTEGMVSFANNIWRDNIHPDDLGVIKEQNTFLDSSIHNNRWEGEYRLRRANGSFATVYDRAFAIRDSKGKLIGMVGAMQDITKRKEEESRMRLLESVILNTNDAVLITNAEPYDSLEHKIVFANFAFTKMTGYTPEELIGKNPQILQNENTSKQELEKLRVAMEQWANCEITVKNVRKNKEEFWLNMRVSPVANNKGIYTHWVSIQRDVTDQKNAEAEKEILLNQLVLNNKELTQFSYITTHNLRAPLTNLVSICKLIQADKIADERTRKLIEGFKMSTNILNDTLNDLIKILIIKENTNWKRETIEFNAVLEKVKASMMLKILNNVATIKTDFSQVPTVVFSGAYLESIFLNLLSNALKYAHPQRHPVINIQSRIEGDGNRVLIFSDNGLGMNMDRVKHKIFGLHQRFHENTDSKGIGLYIVHSQVTALGGKIQVDSTEGEGTTFTIVFNKGDQLDLLE